MENAEIKFDTQTIIQSVRLLGAARELKLIDFSKAQPWIAEASADQIVIWFRCRDSSDYSVSNDGCLLRAIAKRSNPESVKVTELAKPTWPIFLSAADFRPCGREVLFVISAWSDIMFAELEESYLPLDPSRVSMEPDAEVRISSLPTDDAAAWLRVSLVDGRFGYYFISGLPDLERKLIYSNSGHHNR